MNAKENAHPIVAATERAAGTAACSRATISYQHYSTAECDRQPKIADLLCRGQENAVPLRNLESLTGLDGRTIRAMIATERRDAPGVSCAVSISSPSKYANAAFRPNPASASDTDEIAALW